MQGGTQQSDFETVKIKGEEFYKTLDSAFCPYFREKVLFTNEGINHLKFKKHAKARSLQDQYMRYKLLYLIPEVLNKSGTVQGVFETKSFERTRVSSRTDLLLRPVTYYEFVAVIKSYRVKVIIKQVGCGSLIFWSVIPSWKKAESSGDRKLYSGLPDQD